MGRGDLTQERGSANSGGKEERKTGLKSPGPQRNTCLYAAKRFYKQGRAGHFGRLLVTLLVPKEDNGLLG